MYSESQYNIIAQSHEHDMVYDIGRSFARVFLTQPIVKF